MRFPLILLQAKAGGMVFTQSPHRKGELVVSINSPSGEGGGEEEQKQDGCKPQKLFPLILLQAKAGGLHQNYMGRLTQ